MINIFQIKKMDSVVNGVEENWVSVQKKLKAYLYLTTQNRLQD